MKKIDKILIVIPNTRWFNRRYFHITAYTSCLLAAIVKDYAEVHILDANLENLDFLQVQERIQGYAPDLVGTSCMTVEYSASAHKILEITKTIDPSIVTVLGGIYGTLLPHVAIEDGHIDYVIIGEGEKRFPELLHRLNNNGSFMDFDGIAFREKGKHIILPQKTFVENLDEIPFPDYSKVKTSLYFNKVNKGSLVNLPAHYPFADTITSRGCPFHCIFCSSQAINGPKIRYRSANNVLEEIDWLVNTCGIKHITFNDDNFFLDKKRVRQILKGIIERNYGISWKSVNAAVYTLDDEILELIKQSGGYQIFLAIESGNQHVLNDIIKKPLDLKKVKKVVKKCKAIGLQTAGLFIIGLPGETWEQIRETVKFAEDLDADCVMFNIATPIPGSEMYDIAKAKGYIDKDIDFTSLEFFGFGRGLMKTEEFEPFELQVLRAFEWDRINFSSQKKKEIICHMFGITTDELEVLRKETRRNLGVLHMFSKPIVKSA